MNKFFHFMKLTAVNQPITAAGMSQRNTSKTINQLSVIPF